MKHHAPGVTVPPSPSKKQARLQAKAACAVVTNTSRRQCRRDQSFRWQEIRAFGLPEAKEVIVTGVGTDPDKAIQNAFSQAIEQTVGFLVDAETVVKNDQLIRDEILTYSRGYVEKYEVVKRWEEDGLHHATIRAVVARDKLVEKLTGMKIATQ